MILGAVLAGGRSSRFGSDKAAALLGGTSLLEHAGRAIAWHVDLVLVVGGRRGDLCDLPGPDLGPLGGIAGALDHAAAHGFDSVLTIACDMPRVPAGLVETLLAHPCSYCSDSPVLGHWPSALGARLLAHIDAFPDRSIRRWARAVAAKAIAAPSDILNVNTPADLAML